MFQNILVPVDFTDKNRPAIRSAIDLADPDTDTIRLLHVVETIQDIEFDQLSDFYHDLQEKAETSLAQVVEDLGATDRDIRTTVVFGRRAAEIIEFADNNGCDLIVLTTHTIDAESPGGGIGTISHQVALLAGCPVLLLR